LEACAADVRRKTRTCLAGAAGKGGSSTNAGLIGLNPVDCSGARGSMPDTSCNTAQIVVVPIFDMTDR